MELVGVIPMVNRLQGKIAIVSGGATGMGGAASKLFAEEGAAVGIIDRNVEAGQALADKLVAAGHKVIFAEADVSKTDQVEAAVAKVRDELGPVNVLFNHAGTIVIKPFLETTDEEWDDLFAINVRSQFLMTRAVLPMMIEQGKGSIVCTSSISAVVATPTEVLYDSTKGAVHMFSRAVAVEFRDQGIRCNAVCPGFIDTPHGQREVEGLTKYGIDVSDEAIKEQQGRMGVPEDIARAALYLASDESDFVNGTHLFVDNAFTAV